MPANVDGMVREGINAYRAGRKDEARTLLMRAVELDQYNEMGWIWLSAVVDTPEEQRTCLENVLVINPSNETARKGLDVLAQKDTSSTSPPPPQQADDILAGASFTAPAPLPPAAPPPAVEEELPAIDWHDAGIATSSASARHAINEPSMDDYDDWVKDLNLGGTPSSPQMEAAQQFISADIYDEEESDDLFGISKAVNAASTPSQPPKQEDDPFGSGPFGSSSVTEIDSFIDQMRHTPEPPAPAQAPAPRRPKVSPAPDTRSAHELLDHIEDQEAAFHEDEFHEDYDAAEFEQLDPAEFFSYIPKEIKPTRVPGTNEGYPALVLIGLLVVVAANIGAVLFVVNSLQ
ncbi:MAG: hypothetical protein H6672_16100 [Anaerolineaceae bacterium]|nr:hypothetical protein [Anaerolineaceae bacterium]